MNVFVFFIAFFLLTLAIVELFFYLFRVARLPKHQRLLKRLKNFSFHEVTTHPDILRREDFSSIPIVNKISQFIPFTNQFSRFVRQANASGSPSFYALLMILLALGSYLGSYVAVILVTKSQMLSLTASASFCSFPLLYLFSRRKNRLSKFERQLPDALELMARALRAGHAFTSGLKLVSDQFADPIGPEIGETLDQINFGLSVSDALKELTFRINCSDLSFFVVSINLQRDTGGNLAEILESIAHVIRERFKLKGKIRVMAAEGKLSAYILFALPFVFVGLVSISNPKHFEPMFGNPIGHTMIAVPIIMMIFGALVIKKMVNFKI
jgi:tight adherence protein B